MIGVPKLTIKYYTRSFSILNLPCIVPSDFRGNHSYKLPSYFDCMAEANATESVLLIEQNSTAILRNKIEIVLGNMRKNLNVTHI